MEAWDSAKRPAVNSMASIKQLSGGKRRRVEAGTLPLWFIFRGQMATEHQKIVKLGDLYNALQCWASGGGFSALTPSYQWREEQTADQMA